ncbi:MAG TPA: type I-F CRISPR-associated protein Csy3 [Thiolapillus brandeum]|uniref:Type I-F CRISPR-associated protein Csy3 n=1 Tax=Thiolapillus brandeum TaxID=1076588 RepID=A0A831RV96_9GAMM|nr:type I-F CRISPR-associated protein Csy3 [Thiolapillus brandeum]
MTAAKLKTASVLAFERKLDPSDALFHAGDWENRNATDWPAIEIREKSVRGTISNRLKTKEQDPAKLDAAIQNPNLQTVDVATLPADADTLRASFTLRVLGGAGTPSACNNPDYQKALTQVIEQYKSEIGFGELARRYATNLANGRFLWRNRMAAEQVEVDIHKLEQGERTASWHFEAEKYSLRSFDTTDEPLNELAATIQSGLAGDSHVLLEVVAHARMGRGQEAYPSQELILDKGDQKGQKSKTLYQVDGVAAMHSQKIGNALRTIDTWYPNEEGEPLGPIAVEPYGSVTSQGRAYRQPKQKMDFYNLLDQWVLKGQAPETEQQHFVMANLIRGGVFGDKD